MAYAGHLPEPCEWHSSSMTPQTKRGSKPSSSRSGCLGSICFEVIHHGYYAVFDALFLHQNFFYLVLELSYMTSDLFSAQNQIRLYSMTRPGIFPQIYWRTCTVGLTLTHPAINFTLTLDWTSMVFPHTNVGVVQTLSKEVSIRILFGGLVLSTPHLILQFNCYMIMSCIIISR